MLGIIGMGRTGKKVADYAHAFNMQVQYFDPYVVEQTLFYKCNSLSELLNSSDITSLHVHLTAETHHLIGIHNIDHVKQDSLIINTSRGKVLDEEAIVQALQKKIRGIAADVLSTELEDIHKSPLWQAQQKNQNIIITPHIGGASCDAMWACEEFIVELV